MNFLRNLLASIIGFFIAIFLLFIIIAGVGAVLGSAEEIIVKPDSVLELDLTLEIKDYAPKDDNPLAMAMGLSDDKLGLNNVLNAIENAKTDSNIKGISIKSMYINGGMAQTQAIRNKLIDFKQSGKFVYAYNEVYDQKSYYLSSVADSLYLNPLGMIEFKGLSTEVLYFKDFQDKYGVKMEVIRHGKYKSAVEPFLANEMSEANREQTVSFLKSIWTEITKGVNESRNISIADLNTIADNSSGRNADLAKEHRLIDEILYEDEYEEKLKAITNNKKVAYITIEDYIASGKGKDRKSVV